LRNDKQLPVMKAEPLDRKGGSGLEKSTHSIFLILNFSFRNAELPPTGICNSGFVCETSAYRRNWEIKIDGRNTSNERSIFWCIFTI